jgi:hypothetical protein
LILLLQSNAGFRLAGQDRVRIERSAETLDERVTLVREFLARLA